MEVRKYLFWITDGGIQTYEASDDGGFELIKFRGEDTYAGNDLKIFGEWFNKAASIAGDEYIDFCYLSDRPMEFSVSSYETKAKSSWDKSEIISFCSRCIDVASYEVIIDDAHRFVSQGGNVFDKEKVKKLYLKCVPDFAWETKVKVEEKAEEKAEEISLVNRYFMDMLRKLDEK